MKPRLLDECKQQISRYVESGKFGSQRPLTNVFNLLEHGESFVEVVSAIREGKICVLGLRFTNNVDTGYVLEAKMRNKEGYWELVELSNLAGILQAAKAKANAKEKAKADAERAKAEAVRVKVEAEQVARGEAEAKLRVEEMKMQAEAKAAKVKIEAEKADAIERANAAKVAALSHLPSFTNEIVTISTLDGAMYTNISLVRASPDGIIYRIPGSASGGCICYTNLSPDILETFGIDTNCISIAQERAEVKAAADAYYRTILAQQGAVAAGAFKADWQSWWKNQQSAQARKAFEARYGRRPVHFNNPMPRSGH